MTPQEKNVFSKLFPKTELGTHEIELATIDKLKSEYNKLQSANTTIYLDKIEQIRKDVQKGIEQVGDYKDRVKKILSGLRDLGLTDEIGPFQSLQNDIENDFKELVFINNRLK
jgi:hypothetical protein